MSALVPAECPSCGGGCERHCASPTYSWWRCKGRPLEARPCGSFGDVRAMKAHLVRPA